MGHRSKRMKRLSSIGDTAFLVGAVIAIAVILSMFVEFGMQQHMVPLSYQLGAGGVAAVLIALDLFVNEGQEGQYAQPANSETIELAGNHRKAALISFLFGICLFALALWARHFGY